MGGSQPIFSESGSSPIDITDPRWELYLLIQKKVNDQEDIEYKLLGFAALYRFYHYPGSERLRLSQVCFALHVNILFW